MTPRASSEEEPEELEGPEDELDDLEDDEEDVVTLGIPGDEEEGEDASLEELLLQRASGRRGGDPDEDEDDIMLLASERDLSRTEVIRTKVIPIKDRKEFVCKNCHLVKARSQLADADRELCRDCV